MLGSTLCLEAQQLDTWHWCSAAVEKCNSLEHPTELSPEPVLGAPVALRPVG